MRSQRRGRGVRQGAARAGGVAGHLRRQHAGRQLPLRRQRLGAPARRALRHAARDQEPEQLQFLQQAIDFEVQWQIDRIEDGLRDRSRPPCCSTPTRGETRAMRSKEDAHDYRYFPDPDLPPLVIAPEWVERVRAAMPELPRAMAAALPARRRPAGLRRGDDDAEPGLRRATSRPRASACGQPKLVANWLMGEVSQAAERRRPRHRRQPGGARPRWPR